MYLGTVQMLILLLGAVSCSPTWRPPTRSYGSNYYQRLNLDKIRTSGLYGRWLSDNTAGGSINTDAGRRDDDTRFAKADISGRGEQNLTGGIGLSDAHAGGDIIASGQANVSTNLESGRNEDSAFAQGQVGGSLDGDLLTVGGVGINGTNKVQGRSHLTGGGDGKLSAGAGYGRDPQGGRTAGGELGSAGRGRLGGDIAVNNLNAGGDINTSGENKLSANVGFNQDDTSIAGGGELQGSGRGQLTADGNIGKYNGSGSIATVGEGKINAAGGYGKTKNTVHGGGDVGVSSQGQVSTNVGVGNLKGQSDTQGSMDGRITAGGEIGRDNHSIYVVNEVKTDGHGDIISQFAVGDYDGEGRIQASQDSKLTAGAGIRNDDDGLRARGEIEGSGQGDLSSSARLGEHIGHASVNTLGEGKVSSGADVTSNDTAAHVGGHLGGGGYETINSRFGIDSLQGKADNSAAVQGNLTGDAIIYTDDKGIHSKVEGIASGKAGLKGSGDIGNIYSKGNVNADGQAKIGAGAEIASDDDGIRIDGKAGASNQGQFSGDIEVGSQNSDGLTGYGNIAGDGKSNVSAFAGYGVDSNNTLYARGQIGGEKGGKLHGSAGIRKNRSCHIYRDHNNGEVLICNDVSSNGERMVFTDGDAEGHGSAVVKGVISMDTDDTILAGAETKASGHGKVSGGAGVGNIQGTGSAGTDAEGKVYGNAGIITDDEGGVQGIAETGAKGKGNFTTNGTLVGVNAQGVVAAEGEGKVFTGTGVSRDHDGGVQVVSELGSKGSTNFVSSGAVGNVEGRAGVGNEGEGKLTIAGEYARRKDGSIHGKGGVRAESDGKVRGGAGLGSQDGLHGQGSVGASGHGNVSADTDIHRSPTGDINAHAEAGGSVGGTVSVDGDLGTGKDSKFTGKTAVHAGAQGGLAGEFNKTKDGEIHANAEAKSSASGGFRFKFWG